MVFGLVVLLGAGWWWHRGKSRLEVLDVADGGNCGGRRSTIGVTDHAQLTGRDAVWCRLTPPARARERTARGWCPWYPSTGMWRNRRRWYWAICGKACRTPTVSPIRSSKSARWRRSRRWPRRRPGHDAGRSPASDASAAACAGSISSFLRFEIALASNRGECRLTSDPCPWRSSSQQPARVVGVVDRSSSFRPDSSDA